MCQVCTYPRSSRPQKAGYTLALETNKDTAAGDVKWPSYVTQPCHPARPGQTSFLAQL